MATSLGTRVYFCFHYQDVVDQRVQVVRKHWLSKEDHDDSGSFDGTIWNNAAQSGPVAVRRLIDHALENTSVTCVLIGTQTYARRWVRYEIIESIQRRNRLIGVHINGIPDRSRRTSPAGRNPLEHLALSIADDGSSVKVLQYANGDWIPSPDNPGWPLSKPAPADRRGKSLQLSTMYRVYDWAADNGPENFDGWLGL
jgi:antiphage defense system Thoeris ThsB-like protein